MFHSYLKELYLPQWHLPPTMAFTPHNGIYAPHNGIYAPHNGIYSPQWHLPPSTPTDSVDFHLHG